MTDSKDPESPFPVNRLPDPVLSTSQEDLSPASPPYRPQASTSNFHEQQVLFVNDPVYSYPPSPAYRSQVDMAEDYREKNDTKPKVHYDDLDPVPIAPALKEHNADTSSLVGTDDEEESDYDWSGEDDLVDEEAKFEERMGVKPKRKGWGFKRIFTLLFSSLIGSTFLAGIVVTPAILLHFYWYKPHPTEHREYVKQNVQAWLFWAAANLVISWYLAVIVDIFPAIFTFIVSAAWGHVSEQVKGRVELYNSVRNTFKPVLYVASGWASWVIIFGHIFNLYDTEDATKSRAPYTLRVYEVVEFLFFLGLVICAQKMLSHAIAFAFHRTAYKERLDELGTALKVIEKLRDYKPKFTAPRQGYSRSGVRSSVFGTPILEMDHFNLFSTGGNKHSRGVSRDDGADADVEDGDRTVVGSSRKSKGKKRSSFFDSKKSTMAGTQDRYESPSIDQHEMGLMSASPSRPESAAGSRPMTPSGLTPINGTSHRYPPTASPSPRPSTEDHAGEPLVTAAKALKTAVLHDARNLKGGDPYNLKGTLGLGGVGSSSEAKRLARAIYYRFKPQHYSRTYLLPADFYPAFPTPEAAEAAFRVFDKDNNGDISRAEIKTTLLKVYKERRSLARSMRDVGIALRSLDHILLFFALVILFFISLSVFGVEVGDSLTSVYSLGIAASFIFKSSASRAFDAIMFLFVTHPYDTGDRCFIDQEILVVKKMGLFATVFTRVDGTETYYFNSQLFTKFITNVRRSDKMFENLTMQVAWRTPLEKLDALEKCLNTWLSTEQNRWFEPATSITLQHIDYQKYLEITIGIGHNGTWQDWGLRCQRKTAFHAATQYYCRQLGIVGYEAPMPIVYGDNNTQMFYPPSSPGFGPAEGYDVDDVGGMASTDGLVPPASPSAVAGDITGAVNNPEQLKSALGFTPPEGTSLAHLRARKSKSRKAMMRGMGDG